MGEETSEAVPAWIKTLIEAQEASRLQQEETIRTLLATLASIAGQPSNSNVASNNDTTRNQSATNKLHAPARPPLLDTTTTYSKFRSWKTIWNDYAMISKLDQFPLKIQKAEFRSCLTEEMRIHIKCAINI